MGEAPTKITCRLLSPTVVVCFFALLGHLAVHVHQSPHRHTLLFWLSSHFSLFLFNASVSLWLFSTASCSLLSLFPSLPDLPCAFFFFSAHTLALSCFLPSPCPGLNSENMQFQRAFLCECHGHSRFPSTALVSIQAFVSPWRATALGRLCRHVHIRPARSSLTPKLQWSHISTPRILL